MIDFKGMTGRLGFEQAKSNQRIEKLAGFQIKILRSALTRYPNVKRVVYSTCSVFAEENEDVVRQVLETNSSYKLVPATNFVNDTWKSFGSPEYGDIGSYCLYAKPNEDFTNGFFVAVFEKLEEGEENQFFNTKIYNFKKHLQSQENWKRKQQRMYGNTSHFENVPVGHNQHFGNADEYSVEEIAHDDNEQVIKTECGDTTGNSSAVKKKKKKNKSNKKAADNIFTESEGNVVNASVSKKEKKRKFSDVGKSLENENGASIKEEKGELNKEFMNEEFPESGKKKKKKKSRNAPEDHPENAVGSNNITSVVAKVKKGVKKEKES